MNINKIQLNIKAAMSSHSSKQLEKDIKNIKTRELLKFQDAKYMIVQLYIQIGKSEYDDQHVLDYRNKNDIWLFIQPKIKNYILFKNEENFNKYKQEEINENDLYLAFKIENNNVVNISL